jgi:hypothetical protein
MIFVYNYLHSLPHIKPEVLKCRLLFTFVIFNIVKRVLDTRFYRFYFLSSYESLDVYTGWSINVFTGIKSKYMTGCTLGVQECEVELLLCLPPGLRSQNSAFCQHILVVMFIGFFRINSNNRFVFVVEVYRTFFFHVVGTEI